MDTIVIPQENLFIGAVVGVCLWGGKCENWKITAVKEIVVRGEKITVIEHKVIE